jgi:hypothetical protein
MSEQLSQGTPSQIVKKTGLVGFFDILGFQSFLKKNKDPQLAADTVLRIIKNIPTTVDSKTNKFFADLVSHRPRRRSWLIFSDTIVLTVPIFPDDSDNARATVLVEFVSASSFLLKHMFDVGLPLRGALAYGDYHVEEDPAVFAGQPLINSHDDAANLDLAACCITESLNTWIFQALLKLGQSQPESSYPAFSDIFFVDYLTPMKMGEPSEMRLVNPFALCGKDDLATADIRQYVMECFWKHGKTICSSAQRKADNTEMFFRHIKFRMTPDTPPLQ